MQCDICQSGLESIYLQKKESPELENERPRWSFLLLEGEYKFWGWMGEMSRRKGDGLHKFPWMPPDHVPYALPCTVQCHTQPPSLDIPYFGCNSPLQVHDVGVTSSELMHDLYQFHRAECWRSHVACLKIRRGTRCWAGSSLTGRSPPAEWNNIHRSPSIMPTLTMDHYSSHTHEMVCVCENVNTQAGVSCDDCKKKKLQCWGNF